MFFHEDAGGGGGGYILQDPLAMIQTVSCVSSLQLCCVLTAFYSTLCSEETEQAGQRLLCTCHSPWSLS